VEGEARHPCLTHHIITHLIISDSVISFINIGRHRWNKEILHGDLFITVDNKPAAPFRHSHATTTEWSSAIEREASR
jgi:hypothetical protein